MPVDAPLVLLPAASPTRRALRRLWQGATWGYAVAIAAMAALAGAYVFVGHDLLGFHKNGAHVVGLLSLALLVGAFGGGLDRRAKLQTLGLVGLLVVQGMLVHLVVVSPWIAAFHPANALVLFWAAFTVARGSAAALDRAPGAASAMPGSAARNPQLAPEPA
jgi:hypothetical protein